MHISEFKLFFKYLKKATHLQIIDLYKRVINDKFILSQIRGFYLI